MQRSRMSRSFSVSLLRLKQLLPPKTKKSSSPRELAVLQLRVKTLEREQEKRQGKVQEQIRRISKEYEELKTRMQKKMGDTPTRQLNQYAAKEGFQVEFKFLEQCYFK